eukprot:scaffold12054_cov126-Isochrysis_galbana.AAC.2
MELVRSISRTSRISNDDPAPPPHHRHRHPPRPGHFVSSDNLVSPGGLGSRPEDGESMADAADAHLGQIVPAEQRKRAAVYVVFAEVVCVLPQANRQEPVADCQHIPRVQLCRNAERIRTPQP